MNPLKKQLLEMDINSIQEKINKSILQQNKIDRIIKMYKIRLKNKLRELQ